MGVVWVVVWRWWYWEGEYGGVGMGVVVWVVFWVSWYGHCGVDGGMDVVWGW